MLEHYKTIYEGGEGELLEKKSRFIATVLFSKVLLFVNFFLRVYLTFHI